MLRKLIMKVFDQFDQGFGGQTKECAVATYTKHLLKRLVVLMYVN